MVELQRNIYILGSNIYILYNIVYNVTLKKLHWHGYIFIMKAAKFEAKPNYNVIIINIIYIALKTVLNGTLRKEQ